MKIQNPKSKIQRSFKPQAINHPASVTYSVGATDVWALNEDSAEKGSAPLSDFDLEERTARFGESIICFCKKAPPNPINSRLVGQLVGCGTSVGANYCEASEKVSKKDFKNTISRCVKEAKETKFFLRMMAAAEPEMAKEARNLYREAKELHLIFAAIYRK